MNRSRDDSSSSSVSVASSNGGKVKRSKSLPASKNPNTVEKVRMIMEQEGRSARNLVSWSIPLDSYGPSKGKSNKYKSMNLQGKPLHSREELEVNNGENAVKKTVNNSNRRSAPRNRKPVNIRARYWAYLFENLRRAVDEIYTTCEGDASVVECKEVLLILDNYHHEFKALIDWLNLQERLERTDIQDRPTSLAWEVRKSSPGRPRQKIISRKVTPVPGINQTGGDRINRKNVPPSVRFLQGKGHPQVAEKKKNGATWADRVKGVKPLKEVEHMERKNGTDNKKEVNHRSKDDDGWETVTPKNRQAKHSKSYKQNHEIKSSDNNSGFETGLNSDHTVNVLPNLETSALGHGHACSNNSYINVVVDRIIGLEGMGNPTAPCTNPVQNGCGEGQQSETIRSSKKVKFCSDLEKITRKAETDGAGQGETHSSGVGMANGNLIEEDTLILKKLQEEEALLAQTLHDEHDASIAVAEQRERDLLRQIQEAKDEDSPEIDTDCDSVRSSSGAKELLQLPTQPLEWAEFVARFEAEQAAAPGLSWSDLVEEEELREPGRAVQMHEKLSSPSRKRTPAESRRKQEEKHRRAEERRQQMHQERTQKIHELTEKVHEVINWKNDLIKRQRELLQSCHAEKLARAEEQRAMQLLNIKKKAQVEDTKVNEIAFINELQEQNKRHEVLMRIEEHESRIQELGLERARMQEMKSSKEESVKERQRALEKERLDRIEELKVKRKEQIARIEQQKMEKDKEREKLAKERARDREMRISALNAAQQEAVTELQKKIQLKHDESERRHQVQLEQRKEKALELSLGKFTSLSSSQNASGNSFQTSASTNGVVGSISFKPDDAGNAATVAANGSSCDAKKQQSGNKEERHDLKMVLPFDGSSSQNIPTVDERSKDDVVHLEEKKKFMRKRLKKLRARMLSKGEDIIKNLENRTPSINKSRIARIVKDVNKLLSNQKAGSGPWPINSVSTLDRWFGELNRNFDKQSSPSTEQTSFRIGGGFAMLEELFSKFLKEQENKDISILPDRSLSNAALVFRNACRSCYDNCIYVLYSGKMTSLIDITHLQVSKNILHGLATTKATSSKKNDVTVAFDVASPSLLSALSVVLRELANRPPNDTSSNVSIVTMAPSNNILESFINRGLDVITYIAASGIIEALSSYFKSIRYEVAPGSNMSGLVENGLALLQALTSFISLRNRLNSNRTQATKMNRKQGANHERDPTHLLETLQQTDLMGIVSVLYGLLLHGGPERPTTLRSAATDDSVTSPTSSELKAIPEHTLSVSFSVLSVLNAVAEMDIYLLQCSLATEGISLAFRHICTYLLWYCVQTDRTDLLHEVIRCVGHFTFDNRLNQDLVDSGAQPTVLQQLCSLPFAYFSNPPLMHVLFPTLIACCYDNKSNLAVLEQDASASMLAEFIQTYLRDNNEGSESQPKSNTKKQMPSSLADIPQFGSSYLLQALQFFTPYDVIRDVEADSATTSSS